MGDHVSKTPPPATNSPPPPNSDDAYGQLDESAFSNQLQFSQHQGYLQGSRNVPSPYDLSAMGGALPAVQQDFAGQRAPYHQGREGPSNMMPQPMYQMQQFPQFPTHGAMQFVDPTAMARAQQQQYMQSQYGSQPIHRPMHLQNPGQPPLLTSYGYGPGPAQFSPVDPRFGGQHMPAGYGVTTELPPDYAAFQRQQSETAPVPSFPRGPPRKPKQSGHALWVGNLPPTANVSDLKDHFSRDATKDIESLFLISKSNCAFVNYRTEAACIAAMNRFHDSRFGGVRLVCRLRRGSTNSTPNTTQPVEPSSESQELPQQPTVQAASDQTEVDSPTIVGMLQEEDDTQTTEQADASLPPGQKVSETYFIVKSLTLQDMEASVVNGIWATQSHNEAALNRAFEEAENVYLIFSANKSGEYFGYARMVSPIKGEPTRLRSGGSSATASASTRTPTDGPQSIVTPATATAPRGRIIDDSARGTIFWEADDAERTTETAQQEQNEPGSGDDQEWGRPFRIEWISTARLPFYRTRGLRNPWNSNREVKIARDGTELEPGIGRRLVGMFHRMPAPPQSGLPMSPMN